MSSLTLSRYFILEQAFFKLHTRTPVTISRSNWGIFLSTLIVFAPQLFQDPTAKMPHCLHTHGYNYESLLINRQLSFMIHWSDEVLSRFFIWALELFFVVAVFSYKNLYFQYYLHVFQGFLHSGLIHSAKSSEILERPLLLNSHQCSGFLAFILIFIFTLITLHCKNTSTMLLFTSST